MKFILNHYWNNYFNSGRYFSSGCYVKLSLKFILNLYWNYYFKSGHYFNSATEHLHKEVTLLQLETGILYCHPHPHNVHLLTRDPWRCEDVSSLVQYHPNLTQQKINLIYILWGFGYGQLWVQETEPRVLPKLRHCNKPGVNML